MTSSWTCDTVIYSHIKHYNSERIFHGVYCVYIQLVWVLRIMNSASFSASKTKAWWRHRMETLSVLLAFVRGIHRWPVDSPHNGPVARNVSCFCSMYALSGWTNNEIAGDLRRHDSHMTPTVIVPTKHSVFQTMVNIRTCSKYSRVPL